MKLGKIIGIIVGASLTIGVASIMAACNIDSLTPKYSRAKINALNKLVNSSYLGDMEKDKIIDSIYLGYVSGLEDLDTTYLNEDGIKAQKALEKGQYVGTGIHFAWGLSGDNIIVTKIVENSPSARAGLKVGDKITKIDEINVRMANQLEIYEKLTYTGSEPVTYTVQNNDGTDVRDIKLVAQTIDITSLESKMLEEKIGYITLWSVKDGTSERLQEAMTDLKNKGSKGVILDLRNLYSSNLEEIYKLCDLFIEDKPVFSVKGKDENFKEYKANSGAYKEKVVILTDEGTRGVIEAFVSAMQKVQGAVVIGGTTAGRGVVGEVVSLEDQTGILVTTGILHSVEGVPLNKDGIVPDIRATIKKEGALEMVTEGKMNPKNDTPLMEAIGQFK